jgi:hypothetical protein
MLPGNTSEEGAVVTSVTVVFVTVSVVWAKATADVPSAIVIARSEAKTFIVSSEIKPWVARSAIFHGGIDESLLVWFPMQKSLGSLIS